jgi:hypothetical protein
MIKLILIFLTVILLTCGCGNGDTLVTASSTENQLPVARIDSISSAKITAGQKVTFKGHGTTANGSIILYNWRSDKDGDLSKAAQFESSKLSPGKHIIYFKVQDSSKAWSAEVQKEIEIKDTTTAETTVTKSAFNVTEITNISGPASGTYPPPFTMDFSASITTDGAGTVTYYWERSDGEKSSTKNIRFYGAYSQGVDYSWKVSKSGNYWIRLHTLTPNKIDSISFSVNVICQPFLVTDVETTGGSASGSYNCPCSLKFSASITTDGACTVKYVWVRSDGITSPVKSITFSSTETKTVDYTWKITESGEYWAQLYIVSPNAIEASSYKIITINCR